MLKSGETQIHKMQGFKKFEQFFNLDPQTTSIQALVDQLKSRRDFDDLELTKGTGPVRLLLFPHYKDMVRDARPLYDSDANCPAQLKEQTIAQVRDALDPAFGSDKEFLELHCEIIAQTQRGKSGPGDLQEPYNLEPEKEDQAGMDPALTMAVAASSPTHTGRRQSRCVRKAL